MCEKDSAQQFISPLNLHFDSQRVMKLPKQQVIFKPSAVVARLRLKPPVAYNLSS